MEIRVLKYFLVVAREENITRAANLLHLTQPTLSRQLMQLEEELDVQLFRRSRHRIILTEEGMLLRRRAEEIVALADKTQEDFMHKHDELAGVIAIGSGELRSSEYLAHLIAGFQKDNPLVQFTFYSGNSDNIKERLERGVLDVGLLQEPVDISKYSFLRTPIQEQWGVFISENSPLATKQSLTPEDLVHMPIIMPDRENIRSELLNWFGPCGEDLQITATGNLAYNLAILARENNSCVFALDLACQYPGLRFIPLSPSVTSGTVLVWKKTQIFSSAVNAFLTYLENSSNV